MLKRIFAMTIFVAMGSVSHAGDIRNKKLCDTIKHEKSTPAAFLVDESFNIVAGPINLGYQALQKSYATDWHEFSTPYKIIFTPKRIKVRQSHLSFSLIYKPAPPLCVNSTTYSVGVGASMRASEFSNPPTHVESVIEPDLDFEDPLNDTPAPTFVNFKFDARILVELERN
jgi:hypothetical protein